MTVRGSDVSVRPMTIQDEPAALALMQASLGGGPTGSRSADFFRWKHRANPFGVSPAWVAEHDGDVVGLRIFMRWRFGGGGLTGPVHAARAVDTATRPDMQGRGIFRRLTTVAVESLRGDTDLIFNTPNASSGPGYLRMGWRTVGRVGVKGRVAHPARFARGAAGARLRLPASAGTDTWCRLRPVSETLADPRLAGLLAELADGQATANRLYTPRTLDYLRWRYADAPGLDYRATAVESGGGLRGVVIVRARRRAGLRELTMTELLADPHDRPTSAHLMALAARSGADHMTVHLDGGLVAALAAGLVPVPRTGPILLARTLRPVRPDPWRPSSWQLSLGDLELF